MHFEKKVNSRKMARIGTLAALATLLFANTTWAYPLDPNKIQVAIDLPNQVNDYTLARDSFDDTIIYIQPKTGLVATANGMPLIGYAAYERGGVKRGLLNMQFSFEIPAQDRDLLMNAIKNQGFVPRPFPFKKTSVVPLIPGWDNEISKKVCTTGTDAMTGKDMTLCETMVEQVRYSEGGPTLGENVAVSVLLSEIGAATISNLLNGGNAFQVDLDARYDAASPAYTALIDVNYEKLSESFASFAAYHDGLCVDIEVSAFWEKELMCDGKPAEDCSVKVTYTDQNGRTINNMYADPDDPKASEKFYEAIEGLRLRFEQEMLVKEAVASVSKEKSAIFTLRADYKRISRNVHFQLQRQSLGKTHEKTTSIPATVLCVKVDSSSGAVSKSREGDCAEFWAGSKSADEYIDIKVSENEQGRRL